MLCLSIPVPAMLYRPIALALPFRITHYPALTMRDLATHSLASQLDSRPSAALPPPSPCVSALCPTATSPSLLATQRRATSILPSMPSHLPSPLCSTAASPLLLATQRRAAHAPLCYALPSPHCPRISRPSATLPLLYYSLHYHRHTALASPVPAPRCPCSTIPCTTIATPSGRGRPACLPDLRVCPTCVSARPACLPLPIPLTLPLPAHSGTGPTRRPAIARARNSTRNPTSPAGSLP